MTSNGFYDYTIFKTDAELRVFLAKVIQVSFYFEVEWIQGFRREICNEITPSDYLQNHVSINQHIAIVDRLQYNQYATWADKIGEIVVSNLLDRQSRMLWIKLDLDRFHDLIKLFNLKLIEYNV